MATTKQKKVAQLIVENIAVDKPLTGGQMLEKVGYSKGIAEYPSRVIESAGVQDELKILGFSIEEADKTISHLLKHGEKEETKIKAAQEIYKRLSGYAAEKHVNLNVNMDMDQDIDSLIEKMEDEIDSGT